MAKRDNDLQTIRTEGGLLPADQLSRIATGDAEGLSPQDYDLPPGEKLNESISQSWSRLCRHWADFQDSRRAIPTDQPGADVTNQKWLLPLFRELGYWQVFANMAYRISSERPFESLTVGLALQRDNYRFPDDGEFRKALEERDMYGKRVCFDLLDRLENHGSKERTDTSQYSIEHVMPQNEKLAPEWWAMLGTDWREVQRQWLHRLGNLTLTGYNSTYSDRPFEEKKTVAGGFNDSSVRLNKFLREQATWTAAEMERRGKQLAQRAVGIWGSLAVDKALVETAKQEEMRERAKRRDVSKVQMSQKARDLFEHLRSRIKEMDGEIIELAEQKSISYHGPAFFLEVLPRKDRLNLLLALDFNEVQDPLGIAKDASQRKFFFYAQYEGGVNVPVWASPDIDKAMPIIRQAREVASA